MTLATAILLLALAFVLSLPWLIPALRASWDKRQVRKTGFDVDGFLRNAKRQQHWPTARWDDREYSREQQRK